MGKPHVISEPGRAPIRAWIEGVELEEQARQQLLKFFEALGFTDPLAVAGRKRLSTILFS